MLSGGGRLIAMTTPQGRRGWFFEAWTRGGDAWQRTRINGSYRIIETTGSVLGNRPLQRLVEDAADAIRTRRAVGPDLAPARLTTSLPTAPSNRAARARRTRRVLVPAR
jgi:hypothetical protein